MEARLSIELDLADGESLERVLPSVMANADSLRAGVAHLVAILIEEHGMDVSLNSFRLLTVASSPIYYQSSVHLPGHRWSSSVNVDQPE